MTLNSSPERHTFHEERYKARKESAGEEPNQDYLEMFNTVAQQKKELEADPEWRKDNLEYDLRSTTWICDKVKADENYAQRLYAAMCNNEFQRNETWPVLSDKRWSCSWRYAGGIVADMREQGDYIDWYCSGIRDGGETTSLFVSESVVAPEIEEDLLKLGWVVIKD